MKTRRSVLGFAAIAASQIMFTNRHRAMAATSNLGLNATISRTGDTLVIEYEFTNRSATPVFVTNKVWRIVDGKAKIDPNFVYSELKSDGHLAIYKAVPGTPADKSPTNLVSPFSTRIDPNQVLQEKITLPVPFNIYREYYKNTMTRDTDGKPIVDFVDSVSFGLGYDLPPEGSKIRREQRFGVDVDIFQNPPGAMAEYGILWSQKFRLKIPVYKILPE